LDLNQHNPDYALPAPLLLFGVFPENLYNLREQLEDSTKVKGSHCRVQFQQAPELDSCQTTLFQIDGALCCIYPRDSLYEYYSNFQQRSTMAALTELTHMPIEPKRTSLL